VKTELFDYYLPPERIAQVPLENRQASRLLVYQRESKEIIHSQFQNITQFLIPGDVLVLNKTRVIPARIFGIKPTGGRVEVLLLKKINELDWEVLVGGKKVFKGTKLIFSEKLSGEITLDLDASGRVISFNTPIESYLEKAGLMPLPPYIHKQLNDPERYQTVYSEVKGSAAAPTAGLHFTKSLLNELSLIGIQIAEIVLHVGLDTFAPVTEVEAETHRIHSEWREVAQPAADIINLAKKEKRRVIAVGTTSMRTLESSAKNGRIYACSGPTNLFIYPGYQFQIVNGMITNFHLPKSTLIMLVSAFAGRENILHCYQEAIKENYRFYSFGDAMLIL
jgi:S-adenosylmethionine:tRNA ribosyltransferase-isomerase